jgi:hypothetical protein
MEMSVTTIAAFPLTLSAPAPLVEGAHKAIQGGSLCSRVFRTVRRRRQPSRDLWDKLKPYIRRLYIEENKTLQQLVTALRDEHDFFPTFVSLLL